MQVNSFVRSIIHCKNYCSCQSWNEGSGLYIQQPERTDVQTLRQNGRFATISIHFINEKIFERNQTKKCQNGCEEKNKDWIQITNQ